MEKCNMTKSQGSSSKKFDNSDSNYVLKREKKLDNKKRLRIDERLYWALKADAATMAMDFGDYLNMIFLDQICKYENNNRI